MCVLHSKYVHQHGVVYIFWVHGVLVVFLLRDIFARGVDSSTLTREWALSKLICHPKIMKKAQEELDTIVGRTRLVLMSDLPNLIYLQAIIKENFCLHLAFPLEVPHFNSKDVQILNYKILANTIVLVNIWVIGRDLKMWKNLLEFDPDQFSTSNIDVGGLSYNLLPFGSSCR
jgi:cytochrome P450